MLESGKKFVKKIPNDHGGGVPDNIKLHTKKAAKVVPDENKSHAGDTSRCRILPGKDVPDMEKELGYMGIPLDSGEKIKIVPSAKK